MDDFVPSTRKTYFIGLRWDSDTGVLKGSLEIRMDSQGSDSLVLRLSESLE